MTNENAAETRALGLIFPSEILWEKLPGSWVSLDEIVAQLPIYRDRFDFVRQFVDRDDISAEERRRNQALLVEESGVAALVERLQLPLEVAQELATIGYALAGWQLTSRHQERLMSGYPTMVKQLQGLRSAARRFEAQVDELQPELSKYLGRVLFNGDGDALDELARQCHNFEARLTDRMPSITRTKRGAPKDVVLQTTVRHLKNALEAATGKTVQSRRLGGSKSRRLAGPLKEFMLSYFRLIRSGAGEGTIARIVHEYEDAGASNSGT